MRKLLQGYAIAYLWLIALTTAADVRILHEYGGLPQVKWQENHSEPLFTSKSEAGGTYRQGVSLPPLSLRRIGPNTNNQLAALLNRMQLPLLVEHPNDGSLISMLCQRWVRDTKGNTFYCELDAEARWSDGVAVTTEDIVFTFEFILNNDHGADAQRDALIQHVDTLRVFSDRVFSINVRGKLTDKRLRKVIALRPLAKHFYRSRSGWPEAFDYLPEPSTSAYYIDRLSSFGSVTLRKTTDWWAADKPFFKNRFNVTRIIYQKYDSAAELMNKFESGEIDSVSLKKKSNWNSSWIKRLNKSKKIATISAYHQGYTLYRGLVINHKHPKLRAKDTRKKLAQAFSQNSKQRQAISEALTLSYSSTQSHNKLKALTERMAGYGFRVQLNKVSTQQLLTLFEQDDYELAWITIEGTPDNPFSGILTHIPSPQEMRAGIENNVFVPGENTPYSRYAFWQWLTLPKETSTRTSSDVLDPFDPASGGSFWISPDAKAAILTKPDRRENESPVNISDERYRP